MTKKATLTEMFEALDDLAARERVALSFARERWPDMPHTTLERKVFVLDGLLSVVAVMATFEDKSRSFIAGLLKEHRGG